MTAKNNVGKTISSRKLKLSILVPVYNEESTIKEVLSKVTNLPIDRYEVLVVDDSSEDSSREIIENFKNHFDKKNVTLKLYLHDKNLGKGAGISTGLKEAKGEYFVIQDADLEYNPTDIIKLLDKGVTNKAQAVYGSRFLGHIKNMPIANYYANKFYNFLLRRLYSTKITDMHTCYKMVKTNLFKELNIKSSGFNYAPELVSKLLLNGVEIEEIPIEYNGRTKKEGKKIGISDGIECTYLLLKYRFTDR